MSQRGLILQTYSNFDGEKYPSLLSKVVKHYFPSLKQLLVLFPDLSTVDLDFQATLASSLKDTDVVVMSSHYDPPVIYTDSRAYLSFKVGSQYLNIK